MNIDAKAFNFQIDCLLQDAQTLADANEDWPFEELPSQYLASLANALLTTVQTN